MKKLFLIAAFLTGLPFVVNADTPIPEGAALYDITLTFTDYPELDDWGPWPVEINLLLGPKSMCLCERISVVTNSDDSISLTVRTSLDIAAMLNYAKTDAYTGGQSHIYTRNYLTQYYSAGGDGGTWTSANRKFNLDSVVSVESFMAAIEADFLDTEGHRTMSDPKENGTTLRTDPKTMLQAMTIKPVAMVGTTPCVAGELQVCELRVRFNHPLSEADYDTITQLQVTHGKIFDIKTDKLILSPDGCEIVGLVKVDVGAISDTVNDPSYRSEESNKGQTRIYLNGSLNSISAGSQIFLDQTDSSSVFAVSDMIKKSIIYRNFSTIRCRVVGFELSPRTKGGSLMFMKW